jgi:hypothetical protein
MNDEQLQAEGRILHNRASRGEVLSETEQARLSVYHTLVEATYPLCMSEDEFLRMAERNRQLQSLVERGEALVTYLQAVLVAAQAERHALRRDYERIAA